MNPIQRYLRLRSRQKSLLSKVLDIVTLLYLFVPVFIVILLVLLKIIFALNLEPSNPFTRIDIWKNISVFLYKAYLFSCPIPLIIWLLNKKRHAEGLLHVYSALIFGFFFATFSYNIAQIIIDLGYLIISLFVSTKTKAS